MAESKSNQNMYIDPRKAPEPEETGTPGGSWFLGSMRAVDFPHHLISVCVCVCVRGKMAVKANKTARFLIGSVARMEASGARIGCRSRTRHAFLTWQPTQKTTANDFHRPVFSPSSFYPACLVSRPLPAAMGGGGARSFGILQLLPMARYIINGSAAFVHS